MTPETEAALANLRGLHLPTGGGGLVQGELVVAVALGFAAALGIGLYRILRARMRDTLRRAALRELALANALEPAERRVAQARLLRRVVRSLAGEPAAVTRGGDWAAALDRTFDTTFFSRGAGAVLVEGLYRRPDATDPALIDAELGRLLARIKA